MDQDAQATGPAPAPARVTTTTVEDTSPASSGVSVSEGTPPPSRGFVSVGTKLAGATIALVVAVTAVVYTGLSAYQRENLLGAKEMAAVAVTTLFADSCAAPIVFADEAGIKDALAVLKRNDSIASGVVWNTTLTGRTAERLAEFGASSVVLVTVPATLEVRRGLDTLELLAPVRGQDAKLVGGVALTFSLARENAAIRAVRQRTLLGSAAIAGGLTLLLLAIARLAIVRPLGKLVLAANKIERGDSSEVDVGSNDEIGRLAWAFRTMSRAIRSREERIRARNHDMRLVLDNVDQGFLTLDSDGLMSEERSRIVDQWFDPPEPAMRFWEYLGRVDPSIGEWFALVWSSIHEDFLPIELCLAQLPHSITQGGQTFDLAYRVIQKGEKLDRVLVVMTDVTARKKRERDEITQRDTMSIFRHILSDRSAFDEFFDEAQALVDSIRSSRGSDAAALKRDLHSLKGTCAVYGIESVAGLCHEFENDLETETDAVTDDRKEELAALWSYLTRVRSQFSRDGGILIDRDEFRSFLGDLRDRIGPDPLVTRCSSWQFEPASKRLELLGEQIKQLAIRLKKGDLLVHIEPTQVRLPPKKWAAFWAVFAHVLRNAVDHGIENREEREAQGKPGSPSIWLSLIRDSQNVVMTIRDDGKGIDWEAIRTKAAAAGLPHATATDLESALFYQGVSSRSEVTSTSGRGVGLAAVLETVRSLGGRIAVHSAKGLGTTFRFLLPGSMLDATPPSISPVASAQRRNAVET